MPDTAAAAPAIDGHAEEEHPAAEHALDVVPAAQPGTSVLRGTDPEEIMEEATALASTLDRAIKGNGLSTRIQGREHVNVEGWQTLGALTGVIAAVDDAEPFTDRNGKPGWKAKATAYRNGIVVGSAVGICTTSEGTWKSRDDYALAGMAQTRAISRALRGPLGWIVHLAGYQPAAAEEIPDTGPRVPLANADDHEQAVEAAALLATAALGDQETARTCALEVAAWLAGDAGTMPHPSALALLALHRRIIAAMAAATADDPDPADAQEAS